MHVRDILVPVDFSPAARRTVERALELVDPGGEVCLLHVVDENTIHAMLEALPRSAVSGSAR